jgi:hypothetical protein
MTRIDSNEENVVRQGLATLFASEGASPGDTVLTGEDGQPATGTPSDNGGSQTGLLRDFLGTNL